MINDDINNICIEYLLFVLIFFSEEDILSVYIKSFFIWLFFGVLASVNGFVREIFLDTHFGEAFSLPLSGITFSFFVFIVTVLLLPYIGHAEEKQYTLIGVFWVVLTMIFEYFFGHFFMGFSSSEVLNVYKFWNGDLFVLVLFVMGISPRVSAKFHDFI